jgi:glutaredoxin
VCAALHGHEQTLVADADFATAESGIVIARHPDGGIMASDIQVYGADWCGLTRGVREYLTNSRIDYDYFDVDRDDEAQQFVLAMNEGRRRFPLVVVQEQVVTEPTIAILHSVIGEHALRPPIRTSPPPAERDEQRPASLTRSRTRRT